MPLPVIAGVLRCTVAGACNGGSRWSNTWHARHDDLTGWTLAEVSAFHDIFKGIYIGPPIDGGNPLIPFCSPGTGVDDWAYTPLDGTSGAFHESDAQDGATAGGSLPAQNAAVLTIRTADRGRQNRGRIYLPPFAKQVAEADGQIDPAFSVQIVNQVQEVQDFLVGTGIHLGVGSYGPYVGLGAPHFTDATSFTMDNLFDVQRRRKS